MSILIMKIFPTSRHFKWEIVVFLYLLLSACTLGRSEEQKNTGSFAMPSIASGSFIAICYNPIEDINSDHPLDILSLEHFKEQMSWLKKEGYSVISIDDLLAARSGNHALPQKAVLITFDDSYQSFYRTFFPVLEALKYPAILAVVDKKVNTTSANLADPYLTEDQMRIMKKSGWIEIASSGHDLYKGTLANPQGDIEWSATTLSYDQSSQKYEEAQEYIQRVENDIKESSLSLMRQIGTKPRVMDWPHGAYNEISVEIARKYGMPVTLTLDNGMASIDHLSAIPRILIHEDLDADKFSEKLRQVGRVIPLRIMQADLDYIYDPDPIQLDRNIEAFVARVHAMNVNTIFMQAFADPKGTGVAGETYFPNPVLPMRADILNHLTWQLQSIDNVKVYGWLPVLSFDFKPTLTPVMAWNPNTGEAAVNNLAYQRASLFDPEVRRLIGSVYESMALQAPIDGVLYHDDAILSDFEDAGNFALKAYKSAGLPETVQELRSDRRIMSKWTDFKIEALINFTTELAQKMRQHRSPLITVRNIYAPLLLNPKSEEWFAQSYGRFLSAYDYTAVEAMPYMENVDEDVAYDWLLNLVEDAKKVETDALQKTVFELQAVDWRKAKRNESRIISTTILRDQMRLLEKHGAFNFGYYPDDFVINSPDINVLNKEILLPN